MTPYTLGAFVNDLFAAIGIGVVFAVIVGVAAWQIGRRL